MMRFFLGCFAILVVAGQSLAQDIKLGHLTYHTGEYGAFGSSFDGVTDFTLSIVNEMPPLGRNFVAVHQDIGTIGEARAVKRLLERERVDILLNPAHDYMSYRDYVLDLVDNKTLPLMPSVHGGAIAAEFGGSASEPLFRGSPMDTSQSLAALQYVQRQGKNSIVIVASEAGGSQLQRDAALDAAQDLGLEVMASIDMQPNLPNYRTIVGRVNKLKPDAVIVFSPPGDGGVLVNDAASAGEAWFIVGTSEWQEPSFFKLTGDANLSKHDDVVFTAFSYNEGAAWDFYQTRVLNSPQASMIGDVNNSYALQYYDLLVITALAIEKAGSLNPDSWAKAMYEVSGGNGIIVSSYQEGIKALRAGQDINYDGVTGSMDFGVTGVPSGTVGIYRWAGLGQLKRINVQF